MSVRVTAQVWAQSKAKGSALLLLLAIADYANDSDVAWPSVETLSRKIRMTRRNTQLLLRQLEESGELEVHSGAGPSGTHLYRVALTESVQDMKGVNFSPAQTLHGVMHNAAAGSDGAKTPGAQGRSPGHPNRYEEPSITNDPSIQAGSDDSEEGELITLTESGWKPIVTPQLTSWASVHAPGLALDKEIARFKHYYTKGRGSRRLDSRWEHVLEEWLTRSANYFPGGTKRHGQPTKPAGQRQPAAIAAYPAATGAGSVIIRGGRHTRQPEPEDRDR